MAAAEHGGLADELVDAARSRQEIAEMMHVPGARVIVLDVGKGSALMADDPHRHARVLEILLEQRDLPVGVAPPALDFRRFQPSARHRHVGWRHRAEAVIAFRGAHASRLSTTTLALV